MRFPDVVYTPELLRELYAHMEWADARIGPLVALRESERA